MYPPRKIYEKKRNLEVFYNFPSVGNGVNIGMSQNPYFLYVRDTFSKNNWRKASPYTMVWI